MTETQAHEELVQHIRTEAKKLAASFIGGHLDSLSAFMNARRSREWGPAITAMSDLRVELTELLTDTYSREIMNGLIHEVQIGNLGQREHPDLWEAPRGLDDDEDPASEPPPKSKRGSKA